MTFEICGKIHDIETIASGRGVRSRAKLKRRFGAGNWRKMKGAATIRLQNGSTRYAEIHWYEAHGIGRKDFKIKRYVD